MSPAGPRYTHGHEAATLASHGTRTAATSAAYLLDELRPGLDLLDVGCGPGTVTLDLAELVAPGVVTGLENVVEPLRAARSEAARRGDTTTRFERGDVLDLPFSDDAFDVVHAHQVLQHLTDPVRALREMARVCRPGGLVAVRDADYAAMTWFPESPGVREWLALYRAVARQNGAEPDAARHLRSWARAAGLEDLTCTVSTWLYADAEGCRWWGESQAERFSGPVFVEQAREHGLGEAGVARIASGWRSWGASPEAWFAVLHGEVLARV